MIITAGPPREQPCWSEPWTTFSARTAFRLPSAAFAVTREPGSPPRHRVEVAGLSWWLGSQLGFDPRQPITPSDWLATPAQRLAEVTAGAVFHDGPGELSQARARLAWYPRDVWLCVLACEWQRIAQEEAFFARDLMRLCLLMRRCCPPCGKWPGTAFARLPGAAVIAPSLAAAVAATGWHPRAAPGPGLHGRCRYP